MVQGVVAVGLSCAAVERVRRNLLSNKEGLGGLRAALSKASASAEGSLAKVERLKWRGFDMPWLQLGRWK